MGAQNVQKPRSERSSRVGCGGAWWGREAAGREHDMAKAVLWPTLASPQYRNYRGCVGGEWPLNKGEGQKLRKREGAADVAEGRGRDLHC